MENNNKINGLINRRERYDAHLRKAGDSRKASMGSKTKEVKEF